MANENELEVIFGADSSDLVQSINDIQRSLKSFAQQLQKVGAAPALDDVNRKLITTKKNAEAIKGAAISKELTNIRPGAAQATQALTNLSRVAQDAPFGFIAIANNLDPLFESFARLDVATKSSGGALKALASSLIGPAGIGLAFATISSLVVKAIQEYGSLGAAVNQVFGLISDSVAASRALNESFAQSGASVAGEVAALQALLQIARDETKAKSTRQQAIDKINESYDKYLPNLSLETIGTQKVTDAVEKLTQSLVRQAQIRGLQDLISKESAKQAEAAASALNNQSVGFEKFIDILKDAVDLNHVDAGVERLYKLGKASDKAGERIKIFNSFLKDLLGKEAESGTLSVPDSKPKIEKAGKTLEQLFYKIREESGKQFQELIDFSETEADRYYDALTKKLASKEKQQAVIDAYNRTNEAIRKGIVGIAPGGPVSTTNDSPELNAIEERFDLLQRFKELGANPPDTSWLTDISAGNLILLDNLNGIYDRMTSVGNLVNEFLAPAFNTLFNDLVSGSQSAVQSVTSFLKNLVKQILVTIAQAAALAAIMSAFGGGGFGGLFKKFLGFGGGGGGAAGAFSGGAGPSGFALAGATTGGGGLGQSLNFRLDGNDLVASVNRTNALNGGMGG